MESLSFLVLSFKKGFKDTLLYHPLAWKIYISRTESGSPINLGNFSPLSQERYQPNSSYGPLTINDCGFIGNTSIREKDCSKILKSQNYFKVFLLGGSSAAGAGVNSNEETISAILENKLLKRYPLKKIKVINFGAGASYTYRQSQIIKSEIINYYPDIIMSFDGFNDAWYWQYQHNFQNFKLKNNKPIPNWADYSYKNYLFNLGFQNKRGNYLLPYLFRISRKISSQFNSKNDPWKYSPEYILSRDIYSSPKIAARYFYNNIASMALLSTFSNKNVCFFQILQGDVHNKLNMTEEERKNLENWKDKISLKYRDFKKETHQSKMLSMYEAYSKILFQDPYDLKKELKGRYKSLDYRNLMNEKGAGSTNYIDNIHTNFEGNKIIAQQMLEDILQSNCL
ncbi:hypothetical protein OA503_01750 [Prochlorococcus sp. AH-716-K03]|nr:hypothetical protein [Prochlorococcus sp. AH-716-K03]